MKEYYKNTSLEDICGEIWKPIVGYEKLYMVSIFGRVKRLSSSEIHIHSDGKKYKSRKKDRVLSQKKHNRGYKMICLTKDEIKKYTTVHRVVALAFLPNPENKRTVNHKNGIKWDNRLENLEWATDSENGIHSFAELGRKGAKTYLGKFGKDHNKSKPIYQFDLDGNLLKEWSNGQEVNRTLGISSSNLSVACLFKRGHNQCDGYLWKFKVDSSCPVRSPKPENIIQIDHSANIIACYKSIRDVERKTRFNRKHISDAISNGNEMYGFKWAYK